MFRSALKIAAQHNESTGHLSKKSMVFKWIQKLDLLLNFSLFHIRFKSDENVVGNRDFLWLSCIIV